MVSPMPQASVDVAEDEAGAAVGGRGDRVLRARGIVPVAAVGGNAPQRRSA